MRYDLFFHQAAEHDQPLLDSDTLSFTASIYRQDDNSRQNAVPSPTAALDFRKRRSMWLEWYKVCKDLVLLTR